MRFAFFSSKFFPCRIKFSEQFHENDVTEFTPDECARMGEELHGASDHVGWWTEENVQPRIHDRVRAPPRKKRRCGHFALLETDGAVPIA
jgi:hypothetical protein